MMPLTLAQLGEAKKPAQYDAHLSTSGGHSNIDTDPIMTTSSLLAKDKYFSSGSSPIDSLLAGEKIQFGMSQSRISEVFVTQNPCLYKSITKEFIFWNLPARCSNLSNSDTS